MIRRANRPSDLRPASVEQSAAAEQLRVPEILITPFPEILITSLPESLAA
jgi:hypothetical protein